MTKHAKRRRPWTSGEVRELKQSARRKIPVTRIARSLHRTEGATRQKAFTIGLSLDTRGR